MKIVENVEQVVTVEIPKGTICNHCGETFEPYDSKIKSFSSDLEESQSVSAELCEVCLIHIIKGFKIVPTGFMSHLPYYASAYDIDHELHQKLFEEWKISNVWNWPDENPYKEYMPVEDEEYENDFYKSETFEDTPTSPANLKVVK